MRSLLAALAIVLPLSLTPAFAEETSGTITELDVENGLIVLDDGNEYLLSEAIDPNGLQVGDKVIVDFEQGDNGILIVNDIEVTQ